MRKSYSRFRNFSLQPIHAAILRSHAGRRGRLGALALVLAAGSAYAQTASVQDDAAQATPARGASQLAPIVVTGQGLEQTGTGPVDGYVAYKSTAGTKTDTPLIKTPQAVSVVTRDQMDVQGVQSVSQALRYTSGINPEQRGTNTDGLEYLYSRGFLVDEYWNGLRTPGPAGGFGYNVTSFDPYLFERIEVLHGPSSVLYGQGSPGGVVNLVSKRPTATPLHEIGVQTGSYGRVQGFFDFSGPLDKDGKLLYRITADGFDTGTQTDHSREKRGSIAPSFTWRPDENTSLTVFANYQSDPEAGIYNSVPAQGTVYGGKVSIPRSFYPGEPSFDSFHKTQESVGYELTHRFNDIWSVKQSYRFLHNEQTIQYAGADGGYAPDGTSLLRTTYRNQGMVNAHTLDNQATAKFKTGSVAHQVTVGLDYQHIQFDHSFYGLSSGYTAPPISVVNPQYGQVMPEPDFMFGTSNAQTLKQLGVYAQDQADIGKWSFLLGLREDWADEDMTAYNTGKTTTQKDRAFTWRAGGVYQFDNGIAPYVSYSTSFQPQAGSGFDGQAFRPSKGEQYEAGVKFQPKGYNSFITVAAFHLVQENVPTPDPAHTGFQVQTGEVRSQGFEIEGHADLTSALKLIASYTYTNLLNTKSNSSNLDKVPVGIPRNTASLWADYTFRQGALGGLQVGGGVRYIDGSYVDAANTLKTSPVTLLDLALRYDLGRASPRLAGWTAALNASNLLDKKYVASCSGITFCTWGQGRVVLASLKYQW